ncbi:hypothetical protein ACET9V_16845 [Aeromonas caviae]|uniref:hypothetical protein n=1 Tax=Aeromonas caviae TaxID=648 RepID=UPI0038D019A1
MNHTTFMKSLSQLAGGSILDIGLASPASMVMGGSNVSLFNQHCGTPISPDQINHLRQRQQCLAARKRRR